MRRTFHAFLLSFLLLGLQQAVVVHAFEHLGGAHEQGASAPQKYQSCATCELLASGADGIPASTTVPGANDACAPVVPFAFTTRAVAAPACYSPRAPPVLP